MELKEILDKVKLSFNNSAEAWNKGLTVDCHFYYRKTQYHIPMGDYKYCYPR